MTYRLRDFENLKRSVESKKLPRRPRERRRGESLDWWDFQVSLERCIERTSAMMAGKYSRRTLLICLGGVSTRYFRIAQART